MNITVYDDLGGSEQCTVAEMSSLAPNHFPLKERVPGVEGQAFELKSWYHAWMNKRQVNTDREPVLMKVEAVDEFQATIPWNQLNQAVFLYEQDGKPLQKGFPIRLYVPDGSSECLNVKSVVTIWFEYDQTVNEASYGFKNRISIDELKMNK
ncbi:molybdopterin-dependent oxidoreductase [Paenibacillus sp. UNC451MF]|uniref:molybdopterin-dependent oxidoreductase n=1 Tax=Paenibacillus sp. UNC451MF TaxID=1449063 RepID=UPI00048C5564|nr:molybdopterin-dependent oxidoreductase [Paenibacillus sp. UNC451MF]